MATITQVRAALYPIINANMTINRQYDVNEVNRFNWRKLVEDFEQNPANGFSPPYVVCQWGNNYEIDGGVVNSVYETWAHFYYMTSISDKTAEEVLSEIETQLYSLRDALRSYTGGVFNYMDSNIDISDSLSCNVYYMQNDVSMYGGALIAKLVFGDCPSL